VDALQLRGSLVDLSSGEVRHLGTADRLSPLQLRLLSWLAAHPGSDHARQQLLDAVWGSQQTSRVVDAAIRGLRKKVEVDPAHPDHILTVHGTGYRFHSRIEAADRELPEQRDSFVGRGAELFCLGDAFNRGATIVTVVGPAGVGKTRLSIRFAETRKVHGFHGEVALAELAEARDGPAMLRIVATALNVPLTHGSDDEVERIGRALSGRGPCLVVLDNLEQVVDVAIPRIERWAALAPEARWLLTSQRPLELPGEQLVRLAPLEEQEAALLFSERAQAAGGPRAPLDRAAIERICTRVERLPLALELAASRVSALGLTGLEELLANSFALLSRSAWEGEARHATLHTAIAWSWSLLAPPQQRTLARCAVFHGPFDDEAAEAVLGIEGALLGSSDRGEQDEKETRSALEQLLLVSLLQAVVTPGQLGAHRFRLSPSVRDFAQTELAGSGDTETVQELHAHWFRSLGNAMREAVGGPGEKQAVQRLSLHLSDLLAAHSWLLEWDIVGAMELALALDAVLAVRGPLTLRIEILRTSLQQSQGLVSPALRARGLASLGASLVDRGEPDEARVALDAARQAAQRPSDPYTMAFVLSREGISRLRLGEADKADGLLEEARCVARQAGLRSLESEALVCQGILAQNRGLLVEAEARLNEALSLSRDAGNLRAQGSALGNLSIVAGRLGRGDEATELRSKALALYSQLDSPGPMTTFILNRAVHHLNTNNPDSAARDSAEALRSFRRLGERNGEAIALSNLGASELVRGNREEAERLLSDGAALHCRIGQRRYEAFARTGLGVLHQLNGALEQAESELVQALDLFTDQGDRQGLSLAEVMLATVKYEQGHNAIAQNLLGDARKRQGGAGDPSLERAIEILETGFGFAQPKPLAPPTGQPASRKELSSDRSSGATTPPASHSQGTPASHYEWLATETLAALRARM